jgi:hypothetical protein
VKNESPPKKRTNKEKYLLEKQDKTLSDASQPTLSREELEQNLRARAWKDDAFRQEFLADPKAVLERDYARYFPKDQIPSELSIKVIEEDEQSICFVLPSKFSGNELPELESFYDEELLGISGGGDPHYSQFHTCPAKATCPLFTCKYGCDLKSGLKRLRL